MKYLLASIIALFTLASVYASRAADMPVKTPAATVASAYSWTGFYVGGDVGGAWTTDPATWTPLPLGPFPPITNFGVNAISAGNGGPGFLGALHAGYNWQFASTWVTGLEGDWSWTKAGGSFTQPWTVFGTGAAEPAGDLTTMSSTLDWMASLRARFGYLITLMWVG
jgi:outer membrane immunogenic protein